jgi:hypothetical protein
VIARFTDGTQAEGSLLVGADGIHSATRRPMDPAAPKPTYTGLFSISGYSHSTTIAPTPDTQHFVFGRRAFFGYWSETAARSGGSSTSQLDEPSREELAATSTQEWKRRLLELFADDLPRISEILQATHVIGVCAQLVDVLIRTCASVQFIVTSREPLHIPGRLCGWCRRWVPRSRLRCSSNAHRLQRRQRA